MQCRDDCRGRLAVRIIVVEEPGGQADGGIRDAVQGLRARRHVPGVLDMLDRALQLLIGASFLR